MSRTGLLRRALTGVVLAPVIAGANNLIVRPTATAAPTRAVPSAHAQPIGRGPAGQAGGPVILYGDSLGAEAQDFFRAELRTAGITTVITETFGGTAICDWLDAMIRDKTTIRPVAVVVEFSGNALTHCMHDAQGGPLAESAYFAKYAADAATVLRIFSPPTLVFFAGLPPSRHEAQAGDTSTAQLNSIYRGRATDDPHARYIDAGAVVLDQGRWTDTLPCLLDEPCADGTGTRNESVNVVRSPDGAHFCPAPGHVSGPCPVWSSGAFRYGTAIARPIAQTLTMPPARLTRPLLTR